MTILKDHLIQSNNRIYFRDDFYKHQFSTLTVTTPEYSTSKMGYYNARLLFTELLSRSPFLFNYLASESLNLSDITKVIKLRFDMAMQDVFKIEGTNPTHITFNRELYNCADRIINRRLGNNLIKVEQGRSIRDLLQCQPMHLKDATDSSRMLEKVITDGILTFDYFLGELKEFKELPKEIKARIVSKEFLRSNDVTPETKNNLEEFYKQLRDTYLRKYNEDLEYLNAKISNLTEELLEKEIKLNELIDLNNAFLMDPNQINENKLKRILESKLINSYSVRNNALHIETKPIVLNIDKDKVNAITQTDKKQAILDDKTLGIGKHKISINLKTFKIAYSPLDKQINYHIESYTCYGTFRNSIENAQANKNLPKLIAIALQMLSQATIGDPAGRNTIGNAYIINKDGLVEINGAFIPVANYLNEGQKIKSLGSRRYYEDRPVS